MTQEEVADLLGDGKKRTIEEISRGINAHYKSVWKSLSKMHGRGEVKKEWDPKRRKYIYLKEKQLYEKTVSEVLADVALLNKPGINYVPLYELRKWAEAIIKELGGDRKTKIRLGLLFEMFELKEEELK